MDYSPQNATFLVKMDFNPFSSEILAFYGMYSIFIFSHRLCAFILGFCVGGGESGCSDCRCSGNGCGGCLQGAVIAGRGKGLGVADVARRRLRFGLLGFGFRLGVGVGV